VVIGCTGHAIAMGAFLLLSGDHRVGVRGPYRLAANEVAIGLTLPHAAVEVLRQRLTPAAFNRAALLAEPFTPDDAVAAGFLDQVVAPDELARVARAVATAAGDLDLDAHAATKARLRAPVLDAVRAGIRADETELASLLVP
jgi:enoyl-CoA hydratase